MPFTFTMPKLTPTMTEGVIVKWHKKEGEFVEVGELLLEVATDKATVEHQTLDEGWLKKILVFEGSSAIINQPLAIFTAQKEESIEGYVPKGIKIEEIKISAETAPTQSGQEIKKEPQKTTLQEPAFAPLPPLKNYEFRQPDEMIKASPLARKLAQEQGLDLSTVAGSGPGGRITSKDLEKAQPAGLVTFGRKESPTHAPGSYEEIPLSPIRRIIGKRLQESKSFIPHFYVTQKIDAESLFSLREQLKNLSLKVSFNDLVIRACALALRKHPQMNRGYNSVNQTIIQFKTIDISIAVSLEEGLITPIIRYADYKSLGLIAKEVRLLSEKAKKGKLKEEEYKGGSFCISNLGMFGITQFAAVINPPQAAILAVGSIEEAPIIRHGQIVPGKTLIVNLSVDHRVIDGSLAAQFLKTLQFLLENPAALVVM